MRTIEGLEPGPLQRSFHEHHALQCGFCTAGILMTLDAYLREHPDPTEAQLKEALAGNLCRCTGYAPIIEAVAEPMKLRSHVRPRDPRCSRCPRSARWPPSRSTCSSTRRSSATSARRQLASLAIAATVLSTAFTIFNFLTYGTTAQVSRLHGAGRDTTPPRSARRRCGWRSGSASCCWC